MYSYKVYLLTFINENTGDFAELNNYVVRFTMPKLEGINHNFTNIYFTDINNKKLVLQFISCNHKHTNATIGVLIPYIADKIQIKMYIDSFYNNLVDRGLYAVWGSRGNKAVQKYDLKTKTVSNVYSGDGTYDYRSLQQDVLGYLYALAYKADTDYKVQKLTIDGTKLWEYDSEDDSSKPHFLSMCQNNILYGDNYANTKFAGIKTEDNSIDFSVTKASEVNAAADWAIDEYGELYSVSNYLAVGKFNKSTGGYSWKSSNYIAQLTPVYYGNYVFDFYSTSMYRISLSNGSSVKIGTLAASPLSQSIVISPSGYLYFASSNNLLYKYSISPFSQLWSVSIPYYAYLEGVTFGSDDLVHLWYNGASSSFGQRAFSPDDGSLVSQDPDFSDSDFYDVDIYPTTKYVSGSPKGVHLLNSYVPIYESDRFYFYSTSGGDTTPPTTTILDTDTTIISRVDGKDKCTVTFEANEPIVEYRVMLGGTSYDTGTLLASDTGSWDSGEDIEVVIDDADIPAEGQYRINIYTKDAAGNWTPYDS